MSKRFYPILIALLAAVGLMAGTPAVQASGIPEPNCVCAYCGYPCGSVHATSCPYYYNANGGGGTTVEEREPYDPANAPIFVAPVGMLGGLFMGGGWFFGEMSGKFEKEGFFGGYHRYMSVKTDNDRFDAAFNFGSHIGGVPWLALGVPLYPVRLGVAAVHEAATKPRPKLVDPNIAVYDLIARNYADLGKSTDVELKKAEARIDTAQMRRNQLLDEHIMANAELREIKEKQGIAAARLKAEKVLDAWSKARDEKIKLAQTITASIREKDAQIKEAIDKANPASFLVDFKMGQTGDRIEKALEDKTLPKGVQESLNRELKATKLMQNAKTTYDIGENVVDIVSSYQKAKADNKDACQWIEDREAREKVWRLDLKLLSVPLSGSVGTAVAATETAMDFAYATTAGVKLGRLIDAEMATLNKLQTANVFQDAQADDWKQANLALKAAQENAGVIRKRGEQYKKMKEENEKNANMRRALSWEFK